MLWLMNERIRFDDTPVVEEIGVISPNHSEETHATVIAKGAPEPRPVGETPVAEGAPEETPVPDEVDQDAAVVEAEPAPEAREPLERPEVADADGALIAPAQIDGDSPQAAQAAAQGEEAAGRVEGASALNDPFDAVQVLEVTRPDAPTEEGSGIEVAAVAPQAAAVSADTASPAIQSRPQSDATPLVDLSSRAIVIDPDNPATPVFDLVRIESDGSAVIAGRSAPGSQVLILADGQELAEVTASATGEFVALLGRDAAQPSANIQLASAGQGDSLLASVESIIVLERPDPAPVEPEIPQDAGVTVEAETPQMPTVSDPAADFAPASAPPVIANTTDGIRVIQPVMIAPDQVSLDSISYDNVGEVVVTGRAQAGQRVWLYVDQLRAADIIVSAGGTWSTTLRGIDEGRYVLRADEITPDGRVSSRAESPFQRQFPTAENLAKLTSEKEVIVQPGSNLWNIAKRRYGEGIQYWVIFDANKDQIRDPDLIYPGQIFELPQGE